MLRNFIWIQIFLINFSINCRSQSFELGKHKILMTENERLRGKLYFSHNFNDSTEIPTVFLINRSDSPIHFHGNSGVLSLKIEAQNKFGKWETINYEQPRNCIIGNIGYYTLPDKAFTWRKIDNSYLRGDFKTQIRFSINTEDSLIISDTFKTSINHYIFLEHFERAIKIHQDYISQNQLSTKKESLYKLRIAKIYIRINKLDKALQIVNNLLKHDENNYEARYYKAILVVNYIPKIRDKISKFEEFAITSECINQLKLIPEWYEEYEKANRMLKTYNNYLPTKEEWSQINYSNCKKVDGEYYCKIDFHINDLVKMNFKQK